MSEPTQPLLRRLKQALTLGTAEIVGILILIAVVSLVALAIFQGEVTEVLSTVSHSV